MVVVSKAVTVCKEEAMVCDVPEAKECEVNQ